MSNSTPLPDRSERSDYLVSYTYKRLLEQVEALQRQVALPTADFVTEYNRILNELKAFQESVASITAAAKAAAVPADDPHQLAEALAAFGRLVQLSESTERLRSLAAARAAADLSELRTNLEHIFIPSPARATLTLTLADPVSPAALAEILHALDVLHREIAGTPLQGLVARVGLPEEAFAGLAR